MKKLIGILVMVFMVFVFTGCEKTQVLTCENVIDEEGLKTVQVYKMTYKGKEIKELKISISFEPEDINHYDMYAGSLDEIFNGMEETKGVTIETNSNKPIYNADITIDYNKATEDTKIEEFNLDMSRPEFNETINELKEDMESNGLTCKIK